MYEGKYYSLVLRLNELKKNPDNNQDEINRLEKILSEATPTDCRGTHVAKTLDIEQWENYILAELERMGIEVTEELIMLITEISLEHFEDIGIIDYGIRFEAYDG